MVLGLLHLRAHVDDREGSAESVRRQERCQPAAKAVRVRLGRDLRGMFRGPQKLLKQAGVERAALDLLHPGLQTIRLRIAPEEAAVKRRYERSHLLIRQARRRVAALLLAPQQPAPHARRPLNRYREIIGRFHVTRKEKGVHGATGAPARRSARPVHWLQVSTMVYWPLATKNASRAP